jgi:VanZ family protein
MRILRWLPSLVLMAVIFWLSSIPGEKVGQVAEPVVARIETSVPATLKLELDWLKIGHVIGYAGLGVALQFAYRPTRERRTSFLLAILTCAAYALTDEFHQGFVPGRHASLSDVALDLAAAVSCLLFFELMGKRKRAID